MPADPLIARPRIAVCLAAYNGMAFISDQLRSILDQDGVNVRVFVSVDRSTDGTEAFISAWAARDERIVLLTSGAVFGGAAANFYRLMRDVPFDDFDAVSLADQDDLWLADKLDRAWKELQRTGADGYSGNVTAFWPDGREVLLDKAQAQRSWDFLFEGAGPGCTYVMRRNLALAIQAVLRRQPAELVHIDYHDWLFYAFARAGQWRWLIDECAKMRYRQHDKNQLGANAGWQALLLRARMVLGGYGFEQSVLIAQTVGLADSGFVKKTLIAGRWGLIRLAFHAAQCRRRRRDQVFFFIAYLLKAVLP